MSGSTWGSITTRLIVLFLLGVGAYFLFTRFSIVSLPPDEHSMEAKYEASGQVLIRHSPVSLKVRDVVVFQIPQNGKLRIARIWALTQDFVTQSNLGVEVNGIPLENPQDDPKGKEGTRSGFAFRAIPESIKNQPVVPRDHFLLFNDNLHSTQPDSQQLGYIPESWILGKVIRSFPW